jgi:hypothetical protein
VRAALANAIPGGGTINNITSSQIGTLGQANTLGTVQQAFVQLAGLIGTALGIPGLGAALAAGFGMVNSYTAQQAEAEAAFTEAMANPEALASLIATDPSVTGPAAVNAAQAAGQSYVSLTAAEAAVVGQMGLATVFSDGSGGYVGFTGHVAGDPAGYTGSIPDSANFFGVDGSPTGTGGVPGTGEGSPGPGGTSSSSGQS